PTPEEQQRIQELSNRFEAVKQAGDTETARNIGSILQSEYGYSFGIGPGGWPYIQAPAKPQIRGEAAPIVQHPTVPARPQPYQPTWLARQGATGKFLQDVIDPLAAGVGNVEAAIGRGVDTAGNAAASLNRVVAPVLWPAALPKGTPPAEPVMSPR